MRPDLILAMQGMNGRKVGETARRRTSGLIEYPSKAVGSGYPWDKVLFGHKIDGAKFTVLAGEFLYLNEIYTVAETELTIATNNDYVFAEFEYGSHDVLIDHTTTKANAEPELEYYRKWLYKLSFTSPDVVSVQLYNHMGGRIDILVGDGTNDEGLTLMGFDADGNPIRDWGRAHA